MSARTIGLLLLLVLVGGAAGYSYAESTSEPTISEDPASPVAAAGPAVPYTPPQVTKPDADLPPLPVSLPTHHERLGEPGDGGVVVPVPDEWDRFSFVDGQQARWTAPGNPSGAYSVRVQVVDLPRTLEQMVAARSAELPLDQRLTDLEIPAGQNGDTLRATFIIDGYRRLQVTRWLSFDGGGIDLEISATGRLIDERGIESLVATIAAQARRQPTAKPSRTDPAVPVT